MSAWDAKGDWALVVDERLNEWRFLGRAVRHAFWGVWYRKRHAVLQWATIILPPNGFWWGVLGGLFWAGIDQGMRMRDDRAARIAQARVVRELGT